MSVAVIVIAVQTKHAGILETIEKCFKYCAPKACKVALRSDFVENIINKKSHELLVHFVIYGHSPVLKVFQSALAYGSCNFENFQNIARAHKSRNARAVHAIPYTYTIQYGLFLSP